IVGVGKRHLGSTYLRTRRHAVAEDHQRQHAAKVPLPLLRAWSGARFGPSLDCTRGPPLACARGRLRAGDHKASKPRGQMSAGRILSAAVVVLGFFGSCLPASAELYPARPIKVIVPTPAGGPVDVVARLVGNYLAAAFGQAVVVDNRPGAGNTIGSKEAAQ